MKIAVAGGTGVVGTHTVAAVRENGHEAIVLARSTGVDVLTGAGLDAALQGVDAVIDVTSTGTQSRKAAVRFFGNATRNLLAAENRAGIGHHVALSIVGAATIDAGYYAGKAAQERVLMALAGGWSILRATQFHEFAQQMATMLRVAGLQLSPVMRCQPVAAAAVGAALAEIAAGEPRGLDHDLAGPHEEQMTRMVKAYLAARGDKRHVFGLTMPGAFGKGIRNGAILPGPDARLDSLTFDDWLAAQTA
ncbi:SDR family oxidoreductase [Humibacter albus]|uniref:SDR family oxidoreductase n=1 Tax=Humibacter albus TaxID=427754 RepID=UPI0003B68109|nr:NAD-dependent epimerase/dehydratase family protein [Humibacter albus]